MRNEDNKLARPTNDNKIISAAVDIAAKSNGSSPVILVSKDTSVRIKADSLGLITQDYLKDKTTVFQKYGNILNDGENSDEIKSVKYLKTDDKIFRVYGENNMEQIRRERSIMSLSPKNMEQECAIDALLSNQIDVVALRGKLLLSKPETEREVGTG